MNDWATKLDWSVLVELWGFTLDQLYPCLGICVASCLEVVVTLRREEAEEVLSAALWIFEVADGIKVVEANLLEKTLLGGGLVEGEEVGPEDEVEGFPLL